MWNFRRKKKNKNEGVILTAEVPDGLDLELRANQKLMATDTFDMPNMVTKTVEMEVYTPPPYVEPTHKEIIEGLEFQDNYEAAFLIRDLKKQNMVLKGKLTKLTKKSNAYKEDLDNANAAIKELMAEKYGTE